MISSCSMDWDYFEKRDENYVELFEAQGWMDFMKASEKIYHGLC